MTDHPLLIAKIPHKVVPQFEAVQVLCGDPENVYTLLAKKAVHLIANARGELLLDMLYIWLLPGYRLFG